MRAIAISATSAVAVNVDDNVGHVGLRGWSLAESATTAAAAHVRIREATSTGAILSTIKFAASGSSTWNHEEAVYCSGDLYFQLVAGTVEGCLFVD